MRARTRVNAEQASKSMMRRLTRRCIWGRLPATGKRATQAPVVSAGVLALARMEEEGNSNTGSPAGGVHAPNRNPARDRPGRAGWRRGPYYRRGRVTPAEGRDRR